MIKLCRGNGGYGKFFSNNRIEYYVHANGLEIKEEVKIGNSTLEKYKSNFSDKKIFHLLVAEGNHSWPTEQINGIDTNKLILEFLKSI